MAQIMHTIALSDTAHDQLKRQHHISSHLINEIGGYLFGDNAQLSISHSVLDKSPSRITSRISTPYYNISANTNPKKERI